MRRNDCAKVGWPEALEVAERQEAEKRKKGQTLVHCTASVPQGHVQALNYSSSPPLFDVICCKNHTGAMRQ